MNATMEMPAVKPDLSVVKLNVTDQAIADLKGKYLHLKISGLEDKEGYKLVYAARQDVKKTRVGVSAYAKSLREDALAWQKKVVSEEKRVVAELESIENHLQGQEDEYNRLKAERDAEIERKEKERIQLRIDALAAYGFAVDYALISTCTDDAFNATLANAKAEWQREQERVAEEKRQQEIERERIEKEREELADLRRKQQEQDELIIKQQEELRQAKLKSRAAELTTLGLTLNGRYNCYALDDINVDINTEICLLNDSEWVILTDNIKFEISRRKEEAAKKHALDARTKERSAEVIGLGMQFHLQTGAFKYRDQLTGEETQVTQHTIETVVEAEWTEIVSGLSRDITAIRKASEDKRKADLENAKREAAEQALQAQRDGEEKKRVAEAERLASASDAEKWKALIGQIQAIKVPEMKSLKSRKRAEEVTGMLSRLVDHIQVGLK